LKFLKDPEQFELDEDDLDIIENCGSWKLEDNKHIDWVISSSQATCGVGGYYLGGELVINDFGDSPEGHGFGTQCLKFLSEILKETHDIIITVEDELTETKGFWNKMRDLGYVSI